MKLSLYYTKYVNIKKLKIRHAGLPVPFAADATIAGVVVVFGAEPNDYNKAVAKLVLDNRVRVGDGVI